MCPIGAWPRPFPNLASSASSRAPRSTLSLCAASLTAIQGGHMRRGLDAFPFQEMAKRIWQEYFVPGGKAARRAV